MDTNIINTQDIQLQDMANAKIKAEDYIQKWNEAHGDKERIDELPAIEAEIEKAIDTYNSLSRNRCFTACKNSEDPMIEACKRLTYGTIGVKEKSVDNTTIIIRELIERNKAIDLLKLDKFCQGIGKDRDWAILVESFNYRLAMRVAEELGVAVAGLKDTYAVSDIARERDLGKDPVSIRTMLATLRKVVSAMIGEEYENKILNHDVKYLCSTYTQKSSKNLLSVKLADHKKFTQIMMEICHNAIKEVGYSVEYKVKK